MVSMERISPSSLSSETRKMGDFLKKTSEMQISDYKRRFSSVKGIYDRFLSKLILQGVDFRKAYDTSLKFFGSKKVKFAAIDGTEYYRRVFDLVIFFGGSYVCLGEVEFKQESEPKVNYYTKYIEEGRGISSCVPMYIDNVPDVDQKFFSEEEPGEISVTIPLEGQEIIDNSEIAERIMHLSEYYLAFKLITKFERDVKVLLMDRNLSGDQAGLISRTSKKSLWRRRSSLIGLEIDGTRIDENHLEISRFRILNWDLDTIPSRGDYLRYKLIFLLEKGDFSLEEVYDRLRIKNEKRRKRVERTLKKLVEKEIIEGKGEKFSLNEKYRDTWEKIKKLTQKLSDRIFLSPKKGEITMNVFKVKKNGKEFWLTTLDLSFLTLFTLYMLIEECWKRTFVFFEALTPNVA